MKRKYILPELSFVEMSICDIITVSIVEVAGDIGNNPDGNAEFVD